MRTLEQDLERAARLHTEGKRDESELLCRRLLDTHPGHPAVEHLMGVLAHFDGRHDEAADLLASACAKSPGSADYLHHLAIVELAREREHEAEQCFQEALGIRPAFPEALVGLGNLKMGSGEHEAAAVHYRRALELNPVQPEALNNLGTLLALGGEPDEAIEVCRRAVEAQPDLKQAHDNLRQLLSVHSGGAAAVEEYRAIVARHPRSAPSCLTLGILLLEEGEVEEAIQLHLQAVALDPEWATAKAMAGRLLSREGRMEEALAYLDEAAKQEPDNPEHLIRLGRLLARMAFNSLAKTCYEQALLLDPNQQAALLGLGSLELQAGMLDQAMERFEAVTDQDPSQALAWHGIAQVHWLRGQRDEAMDIAREWVDKPGVPDAFARLFGSLARSEGDLLHAISVLDAFLELPASRHQRSQLHFAAGHALDRLGDNERAFDHFQQANELSLTAPFDAEAHARLVRQLQAVYDPGTEYRVSELTTERPVFVVGLPRSGTTLVEQILDSHPAVFGAGELQDIQTIAMTLAQRSAPLEYPELTRELSTRDLGTLGEIYLQRIHGLSAEALRVVDKMPTNYIHLGFIRQLFPRARIVHCRRDALDTGLSLYCRDFAGLHRYAYDLGDIGVYTRLYRELMHFWRDDVGLQMLEVDYEELVDDVESVSRRLIEHLDLPWDESCLRFYENPRVVTSASYDAVRRPIYASSVGRWRRYAAQLAPLREALEPSRGYSPTSTAIE